MSATSFFGGAFFGGEFFNTPTPPAPSVGGGGGGSLKHRKSLKELVREWFARAAEEPVAASTPAVETAAEIVKPFVRESVIDWTALEADSKAARAMVAAYVRAKALEADIEEEDEMIVLLH